MFQERMSRAGRHLRARVLLVVRAVRAAVLGFFPVLAVIAAQRVCALFIPHPRLLLTLVTVLKGGVYEDGGVYLGLHRGNVATVRETVPLGVVSLGAERQIHWNRLQNLNVIIY